MDSGVFDINNVEVQMTMVVKLHQLQREALPHLTYQNLEAYLTQNAQGGFLREESHINFAVLTWNVT